MREDVSIKIIPRTPIWTGDINGRSSEIKDLGIMGSLRWWYEAIIRGFDIFSCDLSSHN